MTSQRFLFSIGDEIRQIITWLFGDMYLHLIAVIAVVLFGVCGYMTIEGWNWFDSLYMTVITLSTIGFLEVHPLSFQGRFFTICLIVLGLAIVAAIFTSLTQQVIQKQFSVVLQRRKMKDTIRRLSDHTIIIGFGRLARIVAGELRDAEKPLVIIEQDPDRAEEVKKQNYLVIEGDASVEETLIEAGIERAKNLACLLPKDADNLYIILTAREVAPKLFIATRAEDLAGEKRLQRAGADKIIAPYRLGALKIAEGILRPYVTDFLDLASSNRELNLQIEEIKIPSSSPMLGKSLQEAVVRQRTNVIIAAIISATGAMSFNPGAHAPIESGCTLIAFGKRQDLAELERQLIGT